MEQLDLKQVFQIARRWWWLLLLAPIITGASAYGVSQAQTPLYSASVLVRINPPVSDINDVNAVRLTQDLAETYRLLIVTEPVLTLVIETLDLPYGVEDLEADVTAEAIADTQLVRVSVSDPDPDQAALIANTIASTFTSYMADEADTQIEAMLANLEERTDQLQTQIAALDEQIAELDTVLNAQDAGVQGNLEILISDRAQLQEQVSNLAVEGQSVNVGMASAQTRVSVSEPASPPNSPYVPRTWLNVALGAVAGLILAIGVIALLQYLDNSVSTSVDAAEATGSTVLASISRHANPMAGRGQMYVFTEPWTRQAEAIRMLRANLQFATAGRPVKTIAITSPSSGEGKSTVAANLAIVLAQAGLTTVLVDADLRVPTQHKIFGIHNDRGLTTLLSQPSHRWQDIAYSIVTPNLHVLPSGPLPPNPADLLSLRRFSELLAEMEATADIVLIDTPPVMVVSDPLVVGRQSDGVILIAQPGETRRDALRQTSESLRKGEMRLLGVVLNQVKAKKKAAGSEYYGEYGSVPTQQREAAPDEYYAGNGSAPAQHQRHPASGEYYAGNGAAPAQQHQGHAVPGEHYAGNGAAPPQHHPSSSQGQHTR